jgi:two-component system sensor histidine kinase/response regulator
MPKMNGIDAVRRIVQMHLEPTPRILMVTAYGRGEIMRWADHAAVRGFLIKPVNPFSVVGRHRARLWPQCAR